MKEILEPRGETGKVGPVLSEYEPKVLNRVDATDEQIERVQNRILSGCPCQRRASQYLPQCFL
jgi:hypothetical protein